MTTETLRFLASELPLLAPELCRFHVIPVPYEATVSYGRGTADGPAAILDASQQLELWTGTGNPSEQGIYTWPAVDCAAELEIVRKDIAAAVASALQSRPLDQTDQTDQADQGAAPRASAIPVILGGEHSVTLSALQALKERYGSFGIIHFDAHADLRHSYDGTIYSHACVMRRAVNDLDLPLMQIGVRSLSLEEAAFREEKNIHHLDARHLFAESALIDAEMLLPREDFPPLVYLSFDVDALDASLMPATGTPEPGGLLWWDALRLIRQTLVGRACIGFDVVELAPIPNMHAPNYTAARLVYEIMGLV
jgi:agmatinase